MSHDRVDLLTERKRCLSQALSLSYRRPLHIVKGRGAYLCVIGGGAPGAAHRASHASTSYDTDGNEFLDCVNNVCHVGHCNDEVVNAAVRQLRELNTNTRYLHAHIVHLAKELLATLPPELEVCVFVNSGSEANDLALRMARTVTGRRDVVCLEAAYHGHTDAVLDVSPYKFKGPGGRPQSRGVHVAPVPDNYAGVYRDLPEEEAAELYAAHVRAIVESQRRRGRDVAAFICESMLSCAGQIELPQGYLALCYESVRDAGGVCIADEVQVGFGRMGTHMWGFQTQGVTPDIVTMGKPFGNDAFANGMEYFNTYGGNPVACAVGRAVLRVIQEAHLQEHAHSVGSHLKQRLAEVQQEFPDVVGDVRGRGLFLGIELVADPVTRAPHADLAADVVNFAKEKRLILLSTDGPRHNVIKIKPPMVFSRADADRLVDALRDALAHHVGRAKL